MASNLDAGQAARYLTNLANKHLPLASGSATAGLYDLVEPPPQGLELFRAAAAADILAWRHQTIADLAAKGCSPSMSSPKTSRRRW